MNVIWSPEESAVAVVKASVTDLPLARGTRSAAAIVSDTPVTRPCSSLPDGAPSLARSLLVLTVTPVAFPAVAGPNVTPLSVMTCDPEEAPEASKRNTNEPEPKQCCTERPEIEPTYDGHDGEKKLGG